MVTENSFRQYYGILYNKIMKTKPNICLRSGSLDTSLQILGVLFLPFSLFLCINFR